MDDFQLMDVEDTPNFSGFLLSDRYGGKVKTYYNQLLEKAKDVGDQVKEDKIISPAPVLSMLQGIIDDDLIEKLYEYAVYIHAEKGLPSHAVSVTLASLKMGKGMGYETERLLQLGLAAFFGNVGRYKIPEHILKKEGELSAEEINEIRKYPERSAKILSRMGATFEWLAEVALQVQERSDGSGYPRGLRGEEIPEFASIIGLIDTYIAMIMNRPYRKKHTQTEAVKSIIESGKKKFRPKVLKGFLDQISLYPFSTYVRLNNKAIGMVRSTDRNQLLRPTIELLYDGLGQELEKKKIIDLSNYPLLHIVDTIDEEELDQKQLHEKQLH
ncbi:MAG TPA: HD domain-containing phosphohydrolase [Thermodesulfobacteriota bacterium]|nr:HD domain-containing phosphohydrolase [Thermodesulfobacteriota bacterium]